MIVFCPESLLLYIFFFLCCRDVVLHKKSVFHPVIFNVLRLLSTHVKPKNDTCKLWIQHLITLWRRDTTHRNMRSRTHAHARTHTHTHKV